MPSQEAMAEVAALKICLGISATFLKMQHTELFNAVWCNKKVSSKELLEAMGTEAAKFFKLSSDIQAVLKEEDPTYIKLEAPKEIIINKDGTVVIKE